MQTNQNIGSNSTFCCGCKNDHQQPQDNNTLDTWSWMNCTKSEPTDAIGSFSFSGSRFKSANYIRVAIDTSTIEMTKFMLYNKPVCKLHPDLQVPSWNLQAPKLIISVTGSANKSTIPEPIKKAFKQGITKVSESTGAWIITDGANTGVSRFVGDAVAEADLHAQSNLAVLGIATWGTVAHRNAISTHTNGKFSYRLIEDDDENASLNMDTVLDSNHTHFILVDDGSENQFFQEIFQFRGELENEFRKKSIVFKNDQNNGVGNLPRRFTEADEHVPMVLIVVQGDIKTLSFVKESLIRNVPVLVLANTKGCADWIAKAYSQIKDGEINDIREVIKSIKDPELTNAARQDLEEVAKCFKDNLVTIFRFSDQEKDQDMDTAILHAFLNSQKHKNYDKLKLTLHLNRDDMAKAHIFTGEEKFNSNELGKLMEMALFQNKPKFIELLLDNGLNIKSFLTAGRLLFLYNCDLSEVQLGKRVLLFQSSRETPEIITYEDLKKFLKKFSYDDFEPEFLSSIEETNSQMIKKLLEEIKREHTNFHFDSNTLDDKLKKEVDYPEKNLFIWAILMNRMETAMVFWKIGNHQIGTALFAFNLLKSFSKKFKDLREELDIWTNEFEDLACGVIQVVDKNSDDIVKDVLLLRKIPYYNLNCLQLAAETECLKFISLSRIYNLVSAIWNHRIEMGRFKKINPEKLTQYNHVLNEYNIGYNEEKSCLCCETIRPNADSCDAECQPLCKQPECCCKLECNSCWRRYWSRFEKFLNSPKSCFYYDTFFSTVFLLLFSYMILCEFSCFEGKNSSTNFTTTLAPNVSTGTTQQKCQVPQPSVSELILMGFMVCCIIEELRQFWHIETKKPTSKLFRYFNNKWNWFDFLGCSLYFFGMGFRLYAFEYDCEKAFITARLLYAVDLIIWYSRLLHGLIIFQKLGPKLVMIKKMLIDMVFFILIIIIFVLMFGITAQATLYPGSKLNSTLLKSIVDKAYWPIYGEIKLLEELDNCNETDASHNCHFISYYFSYVALFFYMIIANVLLLNLLIAMFSSTFTNVENDAKRIGKFQRYRLVLEYFHSPIWPPPLNLLRWLLDLKRRKCNSGDINQSVTDWLSDLERKSAEEYLKEENCKYSRLETVGTKSRTS